MTGKVQFLIFSEKKHTLSIVLTCEQISFMEQFTELTQLKWLKAHIHAKKCLGKSSKKAGNVLLTND